MAFWIATNNYIYPMLIFSEIERRWHEDGTQGLPQGVLNSLRKVTPSNGLLTFERFCSGLKVQMSTV